MNNQLIVIGGMGPQASLRLHELLIQHSKLFHNGAPESYPAILHVSIPVPDFIESKAKYDEAFEVIQQVCLGLPLQQAAAIGIACNTAHLMVPKLPLAGTSLISMIEAVTNHIVEASYHTIGLLASPQTIRTGLYHDALEGHGITVVTPAKADVQRLNLLIHQVIDGQNVQSLRSELSDIAKYLQKKGAEAILLGCTELPLIGVDTNLPVVDSLQVLADAMLQKHYTV